MSTGKHLLRRTQECLAPPQAATVGDLFDIYHVELVVNVRESIFDDEIFHVHSSIRRTLSGHNIRDVGHALHAACYHHILHKTHTHM